MVTLSFYLHLHEMFWHPRLGLVLMYLTPMKKLLIVRLPVENEAQAQYIAGFLCPRQ